MAGDQESLNLSRPWETRLADVVEMVREMSTQTDPQAMVRDYGVRARRLIRTDGTVSLSRRDLRAPWYRITRSWHFFEEINPWLEKHRLPLLDRGILGDLIYANQPRLILDFHADPADPAAEHLTGFGTLAFIPMYDGGEAINAVVQLRHEANGFDPQRFPEAVWLTNLFGRATHNLVLRGQVQKAYDEADRELRVVADIQRSLLPDKLPRVPGLDLAVYYQTATRAGGDYYDFFCLPQGQWGILIADVSGHGTPAAVVMAATHAIAHAYPGPPTPPAQMMSFLNQRLASRQAAGTTSFVTAFYAIYDPATRSLTWSNAGHNPPCLRLGADRRVLTLDGAQSMPLGIDPDEPYAQQTRTLASGDLLLLYTDGITEARSGNAARDIFGTDRLASALGNARSDAATTQADILADLARFTNGFSAEDDRTLLVVRVV